MTYRDRRSAKAERLREWADKRDRRADAEWRQAGEMADLIPFGQPILAGHSSQGRDERYRARIAAKMDRSVADGRKAAEMRGRAGNIEAALDASIFDDDPDAIERLSERIARLEAEREAMKAENAAYRKAHRAQLAGLTAFARDRALPHQGYELSNLGGRISADRKRLARLRGPEHE